MNPTRGNSSPKWNSTFATTCRAVFQLERGACLILLDEQGQEHNRTDGILPPQKLPPSLLLGIGKSCFDREQYEEAEHTFQELLSAIT